MKNECVGLNDLLYIFH